MNGPLWQVEFRDDGDIVRARQHARAIAARIGFEPGDQTRIGWAVAEVARGSVRHAGGGRVEFRLESNPSPSLEMRVVDDGPGLAEGSSPADRGVDGLRSLLPTFRVETESQAGLAVVLAVMLPDRAPVPSATDFALLAEEMARLDPPSLGDELHFQERELLRALDEVHARQTEVEQVNGDLEKALAGLLALNLELDEGTVSLRRATSLKTWFLSHVSHELRTPLSSILSLSQLLLNRTDGELSPEQERQVTFILQAAHDLTGMVNDLLDLARIETGREVVRPSEVHLTDLYAALKGMFLPLQQKGSPIAVVFEDPADLPSLVTDEAKLSRVLRIFLSNALKFTQSGEVRVRAEQGPGESVTLSISDTGIGIAPEDLDRIFEEFNQVNGPLQRKVRGPGLGLSLARKIAHLLGGSVKVWSEPGVGSSFSITLPTRAAGEPDRVADPPN